MRWCLVWTGLTLEIWLMYEYNTLTCFRAGSVAVQNMPMHVRRIPWRTMSEFRNKVGKIWIECAKTIRIKREHGLRTGELSLVLLSPNCMTLSKSFSFQESFECLLEKIIFNDMTTWSFWWSTTFINIRN